MVHGIRVMGNALMGADEYVKLGLCSILKRVVTPAYGLGVVGSRWERSFRNVEMPSLEFLGERFWGGEIKMGWAILSQFCESRVLFYIF